MTFFTRKNSVAIIHKSFKTALILKAISDLFEVVGGILLIFVSPPYAKHIINLMTHGELSEDPKDFIANALLHLGNSFSIDIQHFGVIYLLTHGILKLVLVFLLWKKKLWAYPMTIVLLLLFVIYQVYKYILTQSTMLILLTALDLIVIGLTIIEYRNIKRSQ